MVKVSGYTSREVQAATGASQQQVSAWAKAHKWQVVATLGRTKVYSQDDVASFFQARKRRDLMRRAGWSDGRQGQGLIWHEDFDTECSFCGSFGVENPKDFNEYFCPKCGLMRTLV